VIRHELGSRPSVLVVEGDDLLRETLVDVLERAGYAVLAAASCDDALAYLLRAVPPAVLLLDVVMGGMPPDRFRRLLEHEPVLRELPIVVTTARSLPLGFEYPWARATLQEPVHARELVDAVERARDD
jgi:CheY-like chemotaxis protein